MLAKCYSVRLTATMLHAPPRTIPMTAGVVCFAVEPASGQPHLLLGRETCFDDMDSEDGPWCDFGGRIQPGESVLHAAAREFAEESMCTVDTPCGLLDAGHLQKLLRASRYHLRLEVFVPRRDYMVHVRTYFLVQVPWQPQRHARKLRHGQEEICCVPTRYGRTVPQARRRAAIASGTAACPPPDSAGGSAGARAAPRPPCPTTRRGPPSDTSSRGQDYGSSRRLDSNAFVFTRP